MATPRVRAPWGAPEEEPLPYAPVSATACAGLLLATRERAAENPLRALRDFERLWESYARGELALGDTVRVRRAVDTVGRHLVLAALPTGFFLDAEPLDPTRIRALLERVSRALHVALAERCARALDTLGSHLAERAGLSVASEHFGPAPGCENLRRETQEKCLQMRRIFDEGESTWNEYYNLQVDLWAEAETVELEALRATRSWEDPWRLLVSAAPASLELEAARVSIRKRRNSLGGILELPVRHSAVEGREAHEFFALRADARREQLEQDERDAEASALLQDLHAVLGELRIVAVDCGSLRGLRTEALVRREGREVVTVFTLEERALGRVLAEDALARDGAVLAPRGMLVTRRELDAIERAHLPYLVLRDVRFCEASEGVCARCFGLYREDGTWPQLGDRVGALAARSIARTARHLVERWFHLC